MTDKLPPEVAEALAVCDRDLPMHMDGMPSAWQVVRAALLRSTDQKLALEADIERLTDENARLRDVHRWNVDRDGAVLRVCRNEHEKGDECEWETFVPVNRLEQAEAERDALRKQFAEAPRYTVPKVKPKDTTGWALIIESVKNLDALRGKTLALVVVEDAAHD